jgi:hypothetical protein
VQSISLTDAVSTDSRIALASGAHLFDLSDDMAKVLPFVDLVTVDFTESVEECYVVWSGNGYASKAFATETDISTMQLYCNQVLSESFSRRRLSSTQSDGERTVISLPEHDRVHMRTRTVSLRQRRRLQSQSDRVSASDEIFVRRYNFTNDALWYEFTMNSTFCYNSTEEAQTARAFYGNVTGGDDEWAEYKAVLAQTLLNASQQKYRGWSYGFGAVNIPKRMSVYGEEAKDGPSEGGEEGLSAFVVGVIIGIAVLVVAGVVSGIVCCYCRSRNEKGFKKATGQDDEEEEHVDRRTNGDIELLNSNAPVDVW